MSNKRQRKGRSGGEERSEEKLKGKLREYEKLIESQRREINRLLKLVNAIQPTDRSETEKPKIKNKKINKLCPSCKEGEMSHLLDIPKRDGTVTRMGECDSCGYKGKM